MRSTLALLLLALAAGADAGIRLSFDRLDNTYQVVDDDSGWKLAGKIEGVASSVRTFTRSASDPIGSIVLEWTQEGTPLHAEIQRDNGRHSVRFVLRYLKSSTKPVVFPNFTSFPPGLTPFSFQDRNFAPASFSLNQTSTPWLLFDANARSMVLSPASNFMVAKMVGDGKASLGASLNDRLKEVPKSLEQTCLVVFGSGIRHTWDLWGDALRGLYKRKLPAQDSDPVLKLFGYWTDNGADYYYNYDPQKGYAGTLLALRDHYRERQIPLGYLQLDSWWYQKSSDDPAGKPGGVTKNAKLPAGSWNRYGGTLVYRAHTDLFPNGLEAFHREIGLPLITHGRWIDRKSPYHDRYKVSGVGIIDSDWWKETADYLAGSGVICYEQDWLDRIYDNSPEMSSVAGVADAFTDGMASASLAKGMRMQYCMASPRFFLQGVKYGNLSTIRTSDDRFGRDRWAPFLYCSQFAQCIGSWPWCDVFKSSETPNMILSVLSGGPVGIGDSIGSEDRANILKAALPDGVIVKPDRAILPCDQTYTDRTSPFLASTFTDHGRLRTHYFFAFPREAAKKTVRILPRYLGVSGESYLFDLTTGRGEVVDPDYATDLPIESDYTYVMLAPRTSTGVYLIGDLGKFVPTGGQRITSLDDSKDGLRVDVRFAAGEKSVTLDGYCPNAPRVVALRGAASMRYDPVYKRFSIDVAPSGTSAKVLIDGKGARSAVSDGIRLRNGN